MALSIAVVLWSVSNHGQQHTLLYSLPYFQLKAVICSFACMFCVCVQILKQILYSNCTLTDWAESSKQMIWTKAQQNWMRVFLAICTQAHYLLVPLYDKPGLFLCVCARVRSYGNGTLSSLYVFFYLRFKIVFEFEMLRIMCFFFVYNHNTLYTHVVVYLFKGRAQ